MTPLASFRTPVSRWMERRGLNGQWATATLSDGLITLQDEAGALILIPFADIAKLRPGMFDTKHGRLWSTWLWPRDGAPRFEISGDYDLAAYTAFMRQAAADMLERDIRVETGSGYALAIYFAVAFGGLTAVMGALVWQYWRTGRDWLPMLIPASIPLTMLLILVATAHGLYLPRRVTRIDQIGRGLPVNPPPGRRDQ